MNPTEPDFPPCQNCGAVLIREHSGQSSPAYVELIQNAEGLWLRCPACGIRENVLDWPLLLLEQLGPRGGGLN